METLKCCQSCSMPLDDEENSGTEKNGSKSNEYCKYCYANGAFTNPSMTLDEMKVNVNTLMQKMKMPADLIDRTIKVLPTLRRWKSKVAVSGEVLV